MRLSDLCVQEFNFYLLSLTFKLSFCFVFLFCILGFSLYKNCFLLTFFPTIIYMHAYKRQAHGF